MQAQEFLEECYYLERKIQAKITEIDKINTVLVNIVPQLKEDPVQTSGSQDRLGDGVAKLCDAKLELVNILIQYIDQVERIYKVLDKVKNQRQYDLLDKYYVRGFSVEEIVDEWGGKSIRYGFKVRKEAIKTVQRILDAENI